MLVFFRLTITFSLSIVAIHATLDFVCITVFAGVLKTCKFTARLLVATVTRAVVDTASKYCFYSIL